jgi:hypothetical protein
MIALVAFVAGAFAFAAGYFTCAMARAAALPAPLPIREAGCYQEGDVVIFESDVDMTAEAVDYVDAQSARELEPFGVKAVLLTGGLHSRKFVGAKPCPVCGKDMARLEARDSLRDLTFNGRRVASVTLYGDLSGEFTLSEEEAHDGQY